MNKNKMAVEEWSLRNKQRNEIRPIHIISKELGHSHVIIRDDLDSALRTSEIQHVRDIWKHELYKTYSIGIRIKNNSDTTLNYKTKEKAIKKKELIIELITAIDSRQSDMDLYGRWVQS